MNKLFTKIAGLTLGLAMAIGVGVAAGNRKESSVAHAEPNGTYNLTIGYTDFTTASYADNNKSHTKDAELDSGDGDSTMSVSYTSSQVMQNSSKIQFQKKAGYIYNTTNLGTINSITLGSATSGLKYYIGSSQNPTSSGSGGFFRIYADTTNSTQTCTTITINYSISGGGDPVSYTSVLVEEKTPLAGNYKGDAYYECQATVTGTGAFSDVVTWSITSTNSYGNDSSIENKASIDANGKITFFDNCTVYAWATAADATTHNASGFAVTASGLIDTPVSTWTKVTSASSVSVNKVYALSNDGVNFASGAVSSSQIALTTAYASIGYYVLEETTGGYHLSFATYSNDAWVSAKSYINNSSSTGLSNSNSATSVWALGEQSSSVYLKNTSNSNRHLGISIDVIRAYAASNIGTNLPVYLYEVGSLPVIECDTIELTGKPTEDMDIGAVATLGYSAKDTSGNDWSGDVVYSISNESTTGVVELSATSGASVTLTAKKAGTARVSVQDEAGNADPDFVDVTVLADPERTELPFGSYNVEIDYTGVAKDDVVPASKDYEIKAKEGKGAGRVWYKNMTIAYSNVTASYANEYTFSKNGSASTATVTTTSELAKVTQVEIKYYNSNRLTMTDASDTEIDVDSSSDNICTYVLNSESFTLSSTSTATSIYYIHITFTAVDESEEFLSLVINKGETSTSFTEGDVPNHVGLTVHENYTTDGETISRYVDVTESVTWNYSIDKIAANTTSYTVTATYGGHTTDPVTVDGFTVTALSKYSRVTSQSELFDGQVVILAVVGKNNKTALAYDSSKLTTQDANFIGEEIASNDEMEFVVRMYGNQFALEHNDSFLNYSGASNAVYLTEETLDFEATKCGWTLDETGLHSEDGNRYLKYNASSPRFACYNDDYEAQVVQLYKSDASVMNTQNKADTFLYRELHLRDISTTDNTDGTACKGDNGYYETAKAVFTSESFADAKSIVLANEDAVTRLTAWAAANDETFDSTNGTFTPAQGSSRIFGSDVDNNMMVTIIVISSMVVITALGVCLILRKRKEQR